MPDKIFSLEEFMADASAVLRETEANLDRLAYSALSTSNALSSDSDNGHNTGAVETARLQQIGQQLAKLSERSNALQKYLQNGLDAPPVDDNYWPQIKILHSQEEERTQLARTLEDSVGQLLANAVFELASCRHLLENDQQAVADGLDALQKEIENGLAGIRHLITDLEPTSILNNFGLGGGIRRYLEQFETRTGIKTGLRINTNVGRLPNTIEIAIFRIIQEALQNVQQHAGATMVEVVFEEQNEMLDFIIIDNGVGMTSDRIDKSRKNFGLARMVDYAELMNGKFRILSEAGNGTRVVLSVPYQHL